MENQHLDRFAHPQFMVRSKFFRIFGGAYYVYDPNDQLILYSNMKSLRIKEDIRLYEGPEMKNELINIKTESVFDIAGVYVIRDSATNEHIGSLKRHGMKSMARDEWSILSADGKTLGTIKEDSMVKALLRRFIDLASLLMPQAYTVTMGNSENATPVGTMKQNFNPFIYKLRVDLTSDTSMQLDPRLAVCAAVLLAAIEGKQS